MEGQEDTFAQCNQFNILQSAIPTSYHCALGHGLKETKHWIHAVGGWMLIFVNIITMNFHPGAFSHGGGWLAAGKILWLTECLNQLGSCAAWVERDNNERKLF